MSFVASWNVSSSSVGTSNWVLKCTVEVCIKQSMFSTDSF